MALYLGYHARPASDLRELTRPGIEHRPDLGRHQVHDGRGEYELSPEEDEAIRLALAEGATRTVTLD